MLNYEDLDLYSNVWVEFDDDPDTLGSYEEFPVELDFVIED